MDEESSSLLTLSGALTSATLSSTSISCFAFFSTRFRRLFPLFSFSLLLFMFTGERLFTKEELNNLKSETRWSMVLLYNMRSVLSSPVNYFTELSRYQPLTHLWSFCLEVQFLLLAPFVRSVFIEENRLKGLNITLSLALALFIPIEIGFGSLPARFWQFLVGSVDLKATRLNSFIKEIPFIETWSNCLLLLCLFTQMLPVFTARILVSLLTCLILHNRWFSSTGLTWLYWIGDRSYSVYLLHWPLLVFYRFRQLRDEEDVMQLRDITIYLVILLMAACVFYSCMEEHFIQSSFYSAFLSTILFYYILCIKVDFFQFEQNTEFDSLSEGNPNPVTNWTCEEKAREVPWPHCQQPKFSFPGPNHRCDRKGDGQLSIMLIGNSYAIYRFPWLYKGLRGNYHTLTVHMRHACQPTLMYRENPSYHIKMWNCPAYTQQCLDLVQRVHPDLLIISQKFNRFPLPFVIMNAISNLLRNHYEFTEAPRSGVSEKDYRDDYLTREFQEALNHYSNYADSIVIDLPMFELPTDISYKLSKQLELNSTLAGLKTHFTLQGSSTFLYIEEVEEMYRHTNGRLRHLRCDKCVWVDVLPALCSPTGECPLYDKDCLLGILKNDGSHLSALGRHLVAPMYNAALSSRIELLLSRKKNEEQREEKLMIPGFTCEKFPGKRERKREMKKICSKKIS